MTSRQIWLLMATGFAFLTWGILGVVTGPLLPEIQADYDLSSTAAGFVFFLWSLGFSVGSLGSKEAVARFPAVPLLAILSALASLFALGLYLAYSYAQFVTAFFLIGAVGGAIFTTGHTLVGRSFPDHRVSALSALDIVFSAGNISSPIVVIGLLSAGYAWETPFLILTVLFLGNAAIFAFALRAGRQKVAGIPDYDDTPDSPPVPSTSDLQVSLPILAVTSFALGWLEQGQHVWLVTYGIAAGQEEQFARLGHAAFLVGMIIARFLAVIFNTRMQSTTALRLLFATYAAGFVILGFGAGSIAYLSGSLMIGIGIGALFPIFLGRATHVNPDRTATFSMIMIAGIASGGQMASLGIGALSDTFGMSRAFMANGIMVAVLMVASEIFRRSTACAFPLRPDPKDETRHTFA